MKMREPREARGKLSGKYGAYAMGLIDHIICCNSPRTHDQAAVSTSKDIQCAYFGVCNYLKEARMC